MDMHTIFLTCAAGGGAVLVIQLILMVLGADGDDGGFSEFEADEAGVGSNHFFGLLSLKTIVSFVTFFGVGGWIAEESGLGTGIQILAAAACGLAAFYIVGFLMVAMHKLESKGNVDLKQAVGQVVPVYLVIPAERGGTGKVTVTLKSQSLEIDAVTDGEELKTGQQVKVVGMSGPETFEVAPV